MDIITTVLPASRGSSKDEMTKKKKKKHPKKPKNQQKPHKSFYTQETNKASRSGVGKRTHKGPPSKFFRLCVSRKVSIIFFFSVDFFATL